MQSTTIAVDLAKSVFEVAVSQRPGQRGRAPPALARASSRASWPSRAPATVVMEACGTAHFWGREAQARGHRVVLLPPHAVRPYVLRNKTDGADAKGLLEAVRNEERPAGARSSPSTSTSSRGSIACARPGWRRAPRGSTPCAVSCASSASRSRWARARSCPTSGALVSDADSAVPERCARCWPRPRARSASSRRAFARSSARSRRWRARATLVRAPAHDPGRRPAHRDGAPRLRRRRRSASRRGATSRAISDSRPASRRAACDGGSVRSASAAIPTCACCSSTARAPCCCTPRRPTREPDRLRTWALDRERARGPQQGGRRPREQAHPHRLGRLATRAGLRRSARERSRMTHPPATASSTRR